MSPNYRTHRASPVRLPDGQVVELDRLIAPAVLSVWRLGFQTQFSCQGGPPDYPHEAEHTEKSSQLLVFGIDSARQIADMVGLAELSEVIEVGDLSETWPESEDRRTAWLTGERVTVCERLNDEWGERSVLWFPHRALAEVTVRLRSLEPSPSPLPISG